jgi:hypothetical protein
MLAPLTSGLHIGDCPGKSNLLVPNVEKSNTPGDDLERLQKHLVQDAFDFIFSGGTVGDFLKSFGGLD